MDNERHAKIAKQYLEDYRSNRSAILKAYQKGIHQVTEVCASAGIPLIAAYGFLYEEFDDIKFYDKIVDLIKFYGL